MPLKIKTCDPFLIYAMRNSWNASQTHTQHTSSLCTVWKQWSRVWRPPKIWLMQRKVPATSAAGEPKTGYDCCSLQAHCWMCDWPCVHSAERHAGMGCSGVGEWVLTLINGGETFPNPVTAAAKLNPQAAVGGDDWLRQFIPTETTWVTGENTPEEPRFDYLHKTIHYKNLNTQVKVY